jgi:hypothetical protein
MLTNNTNKCRLVTATNPHHKSITLAPMHLQPTINLLTDNQSTRPTTDNNKTAISWAASNRSMDSRPIKDIRQIRLITASMENTQIMGTMDNKGIKHNMELRGVWQKLEKVKIVVIYAFYIFNFAIIINILFFRTIE